MTSTAAPAVALSPNFPDAQRRYQTLLLANLYSHEYATMMQRLAAALGVEYSGTDPAVHAQWITEPLADNMCSNFQDGAYIDSATIDVVFEVVRQLGDAWPTRSDRLYRIVQNLVTHVRNRLEGNVTQEAMALIHTSKINELAGRNNLTHEELLLGRAGLRWVLRETWSAKQRTAMPHFLASSLMRVPLVEKVPQSTDFPSFTHETVIAVAQSVFAEFYHGPMH